MGVISFAGLLKSSTVLWMLGVSFNAPKETRNTSLVEICDPSYSYGYKTCDDLHHYVTPTVPGESSQPDFIGDHPWLYTLFYGDSINKVDATRLAVSAKMYEELHCSEHFSGYEKSYTSLQDKEVLKFLETSVLPRIAKENADRAIDQKRAKSCNKDLERGFQQKNRSLRGVTRK